MKILTSKKALIILLTLMCFLSSCTPSFNIKKDAHISFNGKSIAVLAASKDTFTDQICTAITSELSRQTTLKVIQKEEIKKLIPDYPVKITGPYKFAFYTIDHDYKMTDLKKVNRLKEKLKTDILILLWTPSKIINDTYTYLVIMQGFSKNNDDYFAYGKYRIRHTGKQSLEPGAYGSYKKMIKGFSRKFARVTGEKTGTLKK